MFNDWLQVRLTLNILFSFAQFEREIISELRGRQLPQCGDLLADIVGHDCPPYQAILKRISSQDSEPQIAR